MGAKHPQTSFDVIDIEWTNNHFLNKFFMYQWNLSIYRPHSVDFSFSTADKFYIARTTIDRLRWPSAKPSARQAAVAVIDYHMVSYIRRTFPIMLVLISMCVFYMILKHRTLYTKSKMSLNQGKLLTNDANMSTIMFIMLCGEIITRGNNCVRNVLQFIK